MDLFAKKHKKQELFFEEHPNFVIFSENDNYRDYRGAWENGPSRGSERSNKKPNPQMPILDRKKDRDRAP